MTTLENQQMAYYLTFYKLIGIHQILEPENKRIFNYCHLYRLICVLCTLYTQCVLAFGIFGFFVEMEDKIGNFDLFMLLSAYVFNFSLLLKIFTVINKSKNFWELLDVTRVQFLQSPHCRSNNSKLKECKDKLEKITKLFFGFAIFQLTSWFIYPLMINLDINNENVKTHRYRNILNLRYPVTISFYNQYFYVFYANEMIVITCFIYNIFIELLLASLCYILKSQYEVLAHSFGSIGHETEPKNISEIEENSVKACQDFKLVLVDQRELTLKLKLFYSTIRPIVLFSVFSTSVTLISFTYAIFRLTLTSSSSAAIYNAIKFLPSVLTILMQTFGYCHFIGLIDTERGCVNDGIYCCNWTSMNLKFKKLMLLAMRMNDAYKLTIRATPMKIVNLQLFVVILKISYNVLTFLLNTVK